MTINPYDIANELRENARRQGIEDARNHAFRSFAAKRMFKLVKDIYGEDDFDVILHDYVVDIKSREGRKLFSIRVHPNTGAKNSEDKNYDWVFQIPQWNGWSDMMPSDAALRRAATVVGQWIFKNK